MKKRIAIIAICVAFLPFLVLAQDVGTIADTPPEGRVGLQFSYEHLSRTYELDSLQERITQDIWRGALYYSPGPWASIYGFVGASNFPASFVDTERHLHFGGGLKFMLAGGEVFIEAERRTVHIKGGVGLDLKVSRFQSSNGASFRSFQLTEYQAALDFGIKVFMVTSYCGFKFSWINGDMTLVNGTAFDIRGRGLFSSFAGFNLTVAKHLTLTSEYSFFTERTWSLGLRLNI